MSQAGSRVNGWGDLTATEGNSILWPAGANSRKLENNAIFSQSVRFSPFLPISHADFGDGELKKHRLLFQQFSNKMSSPNPPCRLE
jgi:hypothetical protein